MSAKAVYALTVLAAVGALSFLLRAVPFLLFARREPPRLVRYVGSVLSPAAIAMLVVYCYAGYGQTRAPAEHLYGLAEWAAGAVTVAVHLKGRNPLASILSGTALYMVLIRLF